MREKDPTTISLPYGNLELKFNLEVRQCDLIGVYGIAVQRDHHFDVAKAVMNALENPIGSSRLKTIAAGVRNVVIISDDASRLTPVSLIIPHVINELGAGGITDENITIVMANGTHRTMMPHEIVAKLGPEFSARFRVENHDCRRSELVDMGKTPSGVPIIINRTVADADLVIGIGSIVPHRYCGWSGGAKIVLPGVCGEATTVATHLMITKDPAIRLGNVENSVRYEMEEVGNCVGLRFIVNTILDATGRVVSVVAGDPVAAHRAGVIQAERVCAARIPRMADVVVASSFPADVNFWQAGKAFYTSDLVVADNGVIVLVTPAREGLGEHPDFGALLPYSKKSILRMLETGAIEDKLGAAAALAVRLVANRARIIIVTDGLSKEAVEAMGFEHFSSLYLQEAVNRAIELASASVGYPSVVVLREAPDMLPIVCL